MSLPSPPARTVHASTEGPVTKWTGSTTSNAPARQVYKEDFVTSVSKHLFNFKNNYEEEIVKL